MRITVALVLMIISNLSWSQTTWYISNTGSNSNTGLSIEDSFNEINHALSVASCGDSLYIIAGTYHEKIMANTICSDQNRIIIQGDLNQKPWIIGDSLASNKYAVSATGSGYYFRNFRFSSPYPENCSQSNQVIVGSGDHFTFDDVIVFNSGYDGIKTYSNCETNDYAINWKIINSSIYNCGLGCPVEIVNGDGIDFTGCQDCLIDNCIIKDNRGHQIQIKLEANHVAVTNSYIEGTHLFQIGLPGNVPQCDPTNYNADHISITSNTIIAKGDTSAFVFKIADVQQLSIHNNTIIKDSIDNINIGFICFGGCTGSSAWTNTPSAPIVITSNIFANYANTAFEYGADTSFFDPFDIVGSEVTLDYNLFYDVHNQIALPIDGGEHSLVLDPMFCDYPHSLELQNNSPCIDQGDPNLPTDPDGSLNDIGANYYHLPCGTNDMIENHLEFNTISYYPNPFQNKITISCTYDATLTVINSQGKRFINKTLTTGTNDINASHWSPGIYYFYMVGKRNGTTHSFKSIKIE